MALAIESEITKTEKHVEIDPTITDLLFVEKGGIPSKLRELAEEIVKFGLPGLKADISVLYALYYYDLGAQEAEKAMKAHFGADIAERLGITFERVGTLERPGRNFMLEAAEKFKLEMDEITGNRDKFPRMDHSSYNQTRKPLIFS